MMNKFIDNEHKDLFPLNVNDVFVIFLVDPSISFWQLEFATSIPRCFSESLPFQQQAFLASALGAAGGIGGGGILVPLLTSVGGFSIHRAILLTCCSGCCVNSEWQPIGSSCET